MNRVRSILRLILPPVVVTALRKVKRFADRNPEWEYLPGGWPSSTVPDTGWNHGSVAATQEKKWEELRRLVVRSGPLGVAHEATTLSVENLSAHNDIMAFGYVLAIAARGESHVSILDWGGGLGQYFLIAHALLPGVDIEYHCKDMPVVVERARQLLPEARFHDSDECLNRHYDLIFASSSLQYSRDWPRTLNSLAMCTRGYLFVTRLPCVEVEPSFPVLQRPHRYGYATEYVGWFINRSELLAQATDSGLELLREFLVGERPYVPRAPEQCEYRGFLFRPIAASRSDVST